MLIQLSGSRFPLDMGFDPSLSCASLTPRMKTVTLPSGEAVPALGKAPADAGDRSRRAEEIASLRLGLDLASPYRHRRDVWRGRRRELIAEAIAGRRDEAFLQQGLSPTTASRQGTIAAC